ncbi:MAG: hypothetical protein AAGI08_03490 [Bacteroidota bacterium]
MFARFAAALCVACAGLPLLAVAQSEAQPGSSPGWYPYGVDYVVTPFSDTLGGTIAPAPAHQRTHTVRFHSFLGDAEDAYHPLHIPAYTLRSGTKYRAIDLPSRQGSRTVFARVLSEGMRSVLAVDVRSVAPAVYLEDEAGGLWPVAAQDSSRLIAALGSGCSDDPRLGALVGHCPTPPPAVHHEPIQYGLVGGLRSGTYAFAAPALGDRPDEGMVAGFYVRGTPAYGRGWITVQAEALISSGVADVPAFEVCPAPAPAKSPACRVFGGALFDVISLELPLLMQARVRLGGIDVLAGGGIGGRLQLRERVSMPDPSASAAFSDQSGFDWILGGEVALNPISIRFRLREAAFARSVTFGSFGGSAVRTAGVQWTIGYRL